MAVVIRLKRMGTNKKPFHRIVVADKRSPRDGRFIEGIGHYDPRKKPTELKIDSERARYWLSVGAKPSVTVKNLFKKTGVTKV